MRLKIIYLVILLMGCCLQSCVSDEIDDGTILIPGDELPDFSVTLNDGSVVSYKSLEGKVGVLVFFNTDCPDCQEELPVVEQLWQKYKDNQNVVIAAISREEGAKEIEEYWSLNGLSIPWSAQENRKVYNKFASSSIPRIFISNPERVIVDTFADVLLPSFQDLDFAVYNTLP
ncbi:MAG: TlpA family protein disulfide reductase [Muribaculaceae bacterium]|nr:TlpA family protein disulfide reductase [Muribaculaceae bacterium]